MNYQELSGLVHQRPGMYGLDGSFSHFCIFLEGCHAGSPWSLLTGWREWLVVQLGEVSAGNNLAWPALVLELAFPEGWSTERNERSGSSPLPSLDDKANARAVEALFRLLDAFLEQREQYEGLAKIFREYSAWLERYTARIKKRNLHLSEGEKQR